MIRHCDEEEVEHPVATQFVNDFVVPVAERDLIKLELDGRRRRLKFRLSSVGGW